ncbi:MAG: YebC/PmpR family DNA-binding transcriptional regulator [Acidimicrobiia bacterium]|nr:YebC/PmpR family DNA-binding transcriptional regulator [Acidimicrobiia bacterium]MYC57308.1 YebC/PmpR family DNA-binding transcriptional regulator [Acidimicrobiia bacterium]MYG94511.1 YebC/PmpR family DNA-binding transcriptional regulator [Acidimicrobiia bacterium]MYI31009.1 YebC/PmpR family DNA-binding transcriptional regulator [Acidimicrobiia bacterium]
MSGHSKWATIKHRKGAADKRRGKLFAKLIRQVEVAARQGGSDPEANPTLRTMFQKARDNSVPLDTIERAIKRGTGELEGVSYESVFYEGYASGGVALYVDALTDNRNRTSSEVRALFTRNGGSLAEPGAVAWQFERKGIVILDRAVDEEELMLVALEAGAENLVDEGDTWRLTCDPSDLLGLRESLDGAAIPIISAASTMLPISVVGIDNVEDARAVLRLIDALDDQDDVQDVYANFDVPDEVLQAAAN